MEKNHRYTTGFSVRSTAPITTEQYWSFFDTVRKSTRKILVYTNSMHAQGIMTCHYSFRCTTTLLPSSNSGKSMKRNELTLLVSGKIVHIIQLLELKVSVLSKAYIHTCACTGTRITRYCFVCCQDGHYRGHKSCNMSEKTRPHQKISRKMNGTCISRMYVDVHEARHVTVRYIPTHTGHKPDCMELKVLPLPESTKEEVSLKLSQGIPTKRILQGTYRATLNNAFKNRIIHQMCERV